MDLDFERLHALQQAGSFFVTRAKSNFKCRRILWRPIYRSTGLICDQIVEFIVYYSKQAYPERLRRVRYRDDEGGTLVFLTNNVMLPALTICALYKQRWQVELFFKWIKQHLHIKRFIGNSQNAVKTQIWTAVATYVLVAIVRKRLNLDLSLHAMLRILSVTPFEKTPLFQLFSDVHTLHATREDDNQLVGRSRAPARRSQVLRNRSTGPRPSRFGAAWLPG